MPWKQWEHVIMASIQGGMPMINNILAILGFAGFVLDISAKIKLSQLREK